MKFKVGDWVRYIGDYSDKKESIFKLKDKHLKGITTLDFSSFKLWEPKQGEWCWFIKNGEIPLLAKVDRTENSTIIGYVLVDDINYPTALKPIMVYSDKLEPFMGTLPSFLKENK